MASPFLNAALPSELTAIKAAVDAARAARNALNEARAASSIIRRETGNSALARFGFTPGDVVSWPDCGDDGVPFTGKGVVKHGFIGIAGEGVWMTVHATTKAGKLRVKDPNVTVCPTKATRLGTAEELGLA